MNNGFVVLAVDPPGQGERKQYYDPATGHLHLPQCTEEHTHSGLQFVVGGASLARHFIWDVIRGVDYLETRPEVDAARIGLTGNSGGGTQASFLMMAEPRFAAAVPCAFIMTLAAYMQSGQPQDSEQVVRGCFVNGPDHDDYLTILLHPTGPAVQSDLLLLDNGTHDLVTHRTRIQALLAVNHRVFVFDVRGVGAVQSRLVTAHAPPHDHEYKLGCDAMMLNGSTLGLRVFDVLRGYDYLRSRADVEQIGLVGVGSGAIFGYFAAALEVGLADLTFDQLLFSYHDLTRTRFYDRQRYNLKVMAWGLLQHFDLVDLLPCLAPRPCTFVDLCNAQGAPQPPAALLQVATTHGYLPAGWLPTFR